MALRDDATLVARFWAKVDRLSVGECWPWKGSRHPKGYGRIRVGGKYGELISSHRVSWEIAHGRMVPEGKQVCHSCDNPPCCNPDHLWLGSNADNVADKVSKGRQARNVVDVPYETRARGERGGNSKLKEADVLKIRATTRPSTEVAAEYSVHPSLIRYIRARKIWQHI